MLPAARPSSLRQGRWVERCAGFTLGKTFQLTDASKRPIYVDAPSAVRIGDETVLFGAKTLLWLSEHVFADTVGLIELAKAGKYIALDTLAGVILDRNGVATTFGKPTGVKRTEHVSAVSDGEGGAWVVWLSGPVTDTYPAQIWIARYRKGHWDPPEQVASLFDITPLSMSISAAGPSMPPVIALSGADTVGRNESGVAIVRKDGGAWRTTWFSEVWRPFRVEVARLTDHRLVLAFLGSAGPSRTLADSNSVFVSQSADNGQSWSPLRIVDNNWNYRANWIQMRSSDSMNLHLLWMVDHGQGTKSALVHATSSDAGVHWKREHEKAHASLRGLASVATTNGLTYVSLNAEDDSIALVDLRNHEGPAVTPLPWQGTGLPPSATTFGNPSGPVLLTWGVLVEGAYPLFPTMGVPVTRYAWLLPCTR
jgi:hypothetical protein